MRRMHKSDMCGVNKSLPYIAMDPLGCPQPTLSGMVPLCRCAQLFRPMFSRKSGVVKCISRNAVDAANILWLISGNPEKPDSHQPLTKHRFPRTALTVVARGSQPPPPTTTYMVRSTKCYEFNLENPAFINRSCQCTNYYSEKA